MTFVHRVQRERNLSKPWQYRESCLCGFRGPWKSRGRNSGHPDGRATVSRTDLRDIQSLVGVAYVRHVDHGMWEVHYKCGHEVHGLSDFDLAVARRSHTVVVCQSQRPAAAATDTGLPSDRSGTPVKGGPSSAQQGQSTR